MKLNDPVKEIQVKTAAFEPQYGKSTGGVVQIVTKSGGNEFHGSGYYFFRDHNMAAYPALRRNAAEMLGWTRPTSARSSPAEGRDGSIRAIHSASLA